MRILSSVLFLVLSVQSVNAQEKASNEKDQLYSDVAFLAHDSLEGRETGTKGEHIAATYISERFVEIGLQPKGSGDTSFYQFFSKKTRSHPHDTLFSGPKIIGKNVVGFLDNGAKHTIIIGAHYDHLGWGAEGSLHTGDKMIHNGADDNASGVAAMLFLAKRLTEKEAPFNYLFVAFSGEEKGLLGSNHFVKNSEIPLNSVNYMVNMDMVGRLDEDRRLAIYGVGTSPSFIPAINTVENPDFTFVMDSSGFGPSDHTSFYLEDLPVVHFFTGQHAQYHKPEDDVELINFEGLFDVASFIHALILELNTENKLSFEKTRDKQNTAGGFKVTLGVIPDYLFSETGLRIDGVKENRPAAKAGIKKGDVIVVMDNTPVRSIYDYMDILNTLSPGASTEVVLIRGKRKKKVTVVFQ